MAVTLPSVYQDGTATIAANGKTVTGQGTLWRAAILPGDFWGVHKGYALRILSVDSDTQLTLANPWPGPAQTAAAYEIMLQSDNARMQETSRQLLQMLSGGNLASFASIAGTQDAIPYFTAPGVLAIMASSAFGRSLIGASNGAAGRTTLGLGTAAVKNTGTSGDAVPLLNAANTWSGNQTVKTGSASYMSVDSPAGAGMGFTSSRNGSLRWNIEAGSPTAEAGANAGSDFNIYRYSDAGAPISSALGINRATGVVSLSAPLPVASGGLGVGSIAAFQTSLGLGSAAYRNIGTSGAAVPLLDGANTWSQTQTIKSTAFSNLTIDSGVGAGGASQIVARKGGLARFILEMGGAEAESGSNAGSNFRLHSYADSGDYLGAPITVARASGLVTLQTPLGIASGGTGGNSQSTARNALGLGTAAIYNIGTSGANVPLLGAANTWGATQTIDGGVGYAILNLAINGPNAGGTLIQSVRNNQNRWQFYLGNAGNESGGNVGSDAVLYRFADNGALLGDVITFRRSDGQVTIGNNLLVGQTVYASAAQVTQLIVNQAAGTSRPVSYTTNGLLRWQHGASNAPESGANTGSQFYINAYSDTGAYLSTPLTIDRASGLITATQVSIGTLRGADVISSPTFVDSTNRSGAKFDFSAVSTATVRAIRVPDMETSLSKWEIIGDYSVAGAAQIVATNLSAFRSLRISGYIEPSVDGVQLGFQTSTNNGSTWLVDYGYTAITQIASTANPGGVTAPSNVMVLAGGIQNTAGLGINFAVIGENFNKARGTRFLHNAHYYTSGQSVLNIVANRDVSTAARNAIRLIPNAGTITGNLTIEGIRG